MASRRRQRKRARAVLDDEGCTDDQRGLAGESFVEVGSSPATPPSRVSMVDVERLTASMGAVCLHEESPKARPLHPKRAVIRSGQRLQPRHLFKDDPEFQSPRVLPTWSNEELRCFTSFLMLYSDGTSWVAHKNSQFWDGAGVFIQQQLNTPHCRSGNACRTKAIKLAKDFKTPRDAEAHYTSLQQTPSSTPPLATAVPSPITGQPSEAPLSEVEQSAQHAHPQCEAQEADMAALSCQQALVPLQKEDQLRILSTLFSTCISQYIQPNAVPPGDFLQLTVRGMQRLRTAGRTNVIYSLAQGLGTMRPDDSDSLIPALRMPMGLIEYAVNFHTASSIQKVSCPPDYRSWLQTMYILFGTKWAKIFAGPMWSHEPIMQGHELRSGVEGVNKMNPVNALVNVPALSERTLRRDIEQSDFTTGSEVQCAVIAKAAASNPGAWWWIKGDGCDVVKGLCESTAGQWSGDVDLNDGKVRALFEEYQERLQWAKGIGLEARNTRESVHKDLLTAVSKIEEDLEFIHSALQKVNSSYEQKLAGKHTEQTMFALSWEIEELKRLQKDGRSLRTEMSAILDIILTGADLRQNNIARRLASLCQNMCEVIKGVTRFKREPSTHIFVFMVSDELRGQKPYALPVQCLPYAGLKEVDIRRLVTELVSEMVRYGMNVAGLVTNGEFNYLRTKGYSRPLSVLQIRCDVRKKYGRIAQGTLLAMLTPKRMSDGTISAEHPKSPVPTSVMEEVYRWRQQGIDMEDVVDRLRPRTVPSGYTYSTWKPGKEEDTVDKMRSVVAQFEFASQIHHWEDQGVPFRTYLYVPEVHPITKDVFCEREDEAHVFKRIANHTRCGGPDKLCLERYSEALSDPSSGLTYPALTGARKQSVVDAERLFNPDLAEFMERRAYTYEAKYIKTIWNWRRACDERGLSELERSRYNYQFLNLILEELLPWYKEDYDFSLLEVNRSIKNVLGFSKETLVAVVTNIEGREWRRRQNVARKREHPRASTSDDVECFFSVMRDSIERNFTTKQAKFGFRKVCMEFTKRIDPDLPFYYHTSSHTCFYEGPQPDFSEPRSKPKRKSQRAPRREQPAAFSVRRATLPIRGSLSVRPQFHNLPLELPPPPSAATHVSEHSYAQQ